MIRDRHQAKAAYRLLDREQVTHEAVIGGHCRQVLADTASPGDYLLIEDTTAIAYPGLKQTTGLGPIGESFTRGLWAHQTLVVKMDWGRNRQQLLGLLGQRVWARQAKDGGVVGQDQTTRLREDRESQRWMASLCQAQGAMSGATWTYVADRESDIYELFQSAWAHGSSYVIRAAQPRALIGHVEPDLLSAAASAPMLGTAWVDDGKGRMRLAVRGTTLTLRGPTRPGGKLEDHMLNVVHACEIDAPAGEEPACWTLLTDLPTDTLEQCQRILAIYRRRWLVEELHKAMKSGLRVEPTPAGSQQ